jgi:hypothetical protein
LSKKEINRVHHPLRWSYTEARRRIGGDGGNLSDLLRRMHAQISTIAGVELSGVLDRALRIQV